MAEHNSKRRGTNLWIGIGVLVLVGIIAVALSSKHESSVIEDSSATPDTVIQDPAAPQPQTTLETKTPQAAVTKKAPVAQQNYDLLVKEYTDRHVQFDQMCGMFPSQVTYKVGTKILLDNRANQVSTIHIGTANYVLPAYGYQVVGLDSVGKFLIDCNKRQNAGTINVQK